MAGAAAVSSGALAAESTPVVNSLKMRIATAEDDIGYCFAVFDIKPTIYVDGVEEKMVAMADERLGKVTVWTGESFEIRHGDVRIEGFTRAQREAHIDAMAHRVMPDKSKPSGDGLTLVQAADFKEGIVRKTFYDEDSGEYYEEYHPAYAVDIERTPVATGITQPTEACTRVTGSA